MGYGARMTVRNKSGGEVETRVRDVECMFDRGDEGSNVSLWDEVKIPNGASLPANGAQYIEARAGGDCLFSPSQFTLVFDGVGSVTLKDVSKNWFVEKNSNEEQIFVNITNHAEKLDGKAEIRVVVVPQ